MDQAVRSVIREALDTMKTAGADVVEVELPGVQELLQTGSAPSPEFRLQLADYLRTPGTPVQSLQQILDAGLYHIDVEDLLE